MHYSIHIKARHGAKAPEIAVLYFVFYKTDYCRVKKVLDITGPYEAWNPKREIFKGQTPEIERINKILQKEKRRYQELVSKWEQQGKLWIPNELSYYFEKEPKVRNQYITVSEMLIKLELKFNRQERLKNGRVVSSSSNAKCYRYLRESLENFTQRKYRRDFSLFMFRDITREFIQDYVIFELKRGAQNNNSGGIRHKIKHFRSVFGYAKREKVFSVDMTIFDVIKEKLKPKYYLPRTASHYIITSLEAIDRSRLNAKRNFYLDLFLFSYYSGGMSNIDICFLSKKNIHNGQWIIYERTKSDNHVRMILIEKARMLIAKYQKIYGQKKYIFPILKSEDITEKKEYDQVRNITNCVNRCLVWICQKFDIEEKVTWSTARKCFISKMIDEGYHPYQVAEQVGNCPQTIYRYYYSNSNKKEMLEHLNEVL